MMTTRGAHMITLPRRPVSVTPHKDGSQPTASFPFTDCEIHLGREIDLAVVSRRHEAMVCNFVLNDITCTRFVAVTRASHAM